MIVANDTGTGKTATLLGMAANSLGKGLASRVLIVTATDQVAFDSNC